MAVKAAYEVTVTDETDILSLVTWYALTTSATHPTKPTTTKTSDSVPSPWTTNEPSFDPSQGTKYLHTIIQTRWKDGSCTWDNDVQLSSAYEQAKQAWNKANAAKESADTIADSVGVFETPYTEVEWVESNGTQYVYLDWKPPIATWGFEADFIIKNAFNTTVGTWNQSTNVNGYGNVFGTRNGSMTNDVQLGTYTAAGILRFGSAEYKTSGLLKTDKTRQQVSLRGTSLKRGDGTTVTVTRSSETANKPYANMSVFAMHEGVRRAGTGNLAQPATVRIYSLKFYDGNTLAVNLVGAIRNRDGMTGLYDKVKGHFYPAANMTYGASVGNLGESDTVMQALTKKNIQLFIDNRTISRMWSVSAPELDKLEDGQQITVVFSTAIGGSTPTAAGLVGWDEASTTSYSNVYLKLTLADGSDTEWIPCYYGSGTRLTGHYGSGTPVLLTYRENVLYNATTTSAGTMVPRAWYADPNYNTDDVYTRYADTVVAGLNGVKRYSLNMRDANGNWTSIMNQDNNVGATGKTAYTGGLQLGNILYHNSSANIAAGGNTGQMKESQGGLDFRYDVNGVTNVAGTTGLQLRKPVYFVGTIHDDGLFYLDQTKWWTQDTFETGKVYVQVGTAYSSYYAIFLAVNNPAYIYINGELVAYEKYLSDEAAKVAGNYIVSTASNDVWIHTENHGPNSSGAATSDTYGWRIGSVFELVRAGLSYFKMWVENNVAKVRVGLEDAGHSIFSPDGMDVYNNGVNVARFGADGAQVGLTDKSHLTLDYHSLQMVDKDGDTYFHVSDLRVTDGYATLVEVIDNPDDQSHEITVSYPPRSVGTTTVVIDGTTTATVTSVRSTLDGHGVVVIAEELEEFIPVEVTYQTDSSETKALTFGSRSDGSSVGSHSVAIGHNNEVSGFYSMAGGANNHVKTPYAVALGANNSVRNGAFAAIGEGNTANYQGAVAIGGGLTASGLSQTVIGQNNIADTAGKYLLIIGNGPFLSSKSNALAVDWNGNLDFGSTGDHFFVFPNTNTSGEPTITHRRIAFTGYGNLRLDTSTDNGQTWTLGTRYFASEDRIWPVDKGGTGLTASPSMLANLGSTAAADVLQASPRPGITGTLGVGHGGTGITDFGSMVSDDHAMVSVATTKWTQLASKSLAKGKWLILAGCYCAAGSNANGNRQFIVTDATSVSSAALATTVEFPGSTTPLYIVFPVYMQPSATTTYRVFGYQSSGSALNMRVFMRCIRLG